MQLVQHSNIVATVLVTELYPECETVKLDIGRREAFAAIPPSSYLPVQRVQEPYTRHQISAMKVCEMSRF